MPKMASEYSPDPAYSSPTAQYSSNSGGSSSTGSEFFSQSVGIGANSAYSSYANRKVVNRRKRDYSRLSYLSIPEDRYGEESGEEDEEETIDESPEDLQLEFEAARTNGNAYLYMAAQFDDQSCGRRLICEIYQKPHESLTEDEILLQEIFGYPLSQLSEEDEDTPKEIYYRAAQLGTSYQGRAGDKVCARFYPACPHNAEQLINIFVTEDTHTNNIDSDNEPSAHLQPPQTSVRQPFYQAYLSGTTQFQPSKPIFRPDHQEGTALKTNIYQVRQPISRATNSTAKIFKPATSCLNC
ncbi:putative Proteasome assembly chaperone 2 [Daphnia magna]|uniref:Putative Proteasome assembly chaperone 2 n=1 Tax=Daphnia magna TaxID=35525 RepID=A0A165AD81_9CRUS|nr:putative Proteasome assembly chaperone 2 [Daphnia magna]